MMRRNNIFSAVEDVFCAMAFGRSLLWGENETIRAFSNGLSDT